MPNKGFHSVSLRDEVLEAVDAIAPRLQAKPQDGRRRDSRATAIETLILERIEELKKEGVANARRQLDIRLYDEQ